MSAARPRLGAAVLAARGGPAPAPLPERVLQFGEGNFLRAFVDWMLQRLNDRGLFGGRAVLVQPLARGQAQALNEQDGLYTVVLRGLEDGRRVETRELVSSVSRCIDPYRHFDAFLACARNPDLRFVVSNTTEAGIRTDPQDCLDARPAASFPGKLTQLLEARWRHCGGDRSRGLVVLPCELIERNGDALLAAVLDTARAWGLPAAFARWVRESCLFTNTLVDRIVTGHPRDEAEAFGAALGYDDALLVAGEPFHAWVIETPSTLADELPLAQAGLNVVETRDLAPYRERKVRILNGAHTMMALGGLLAGRDTVGACMGDPLLRAWVQRAVAREIIPTLAFPPDELAAFAASVYQRFENPFVRHHLTSIALNSASKFRARLLGSLAEATRRSGRPPPHLTFALACLVAFYRRDDVQDDPRVRAFFQQAWRDCPNGAETPERCVALVRRVLARQDLWGHDVGRALPGLDVHVAAFLRGIVTAGAAPTLRRLIDG